MKKEKSEHKNYIDMEIYLADIKRYRETAETQKMLLDALRLGYTYFSGKVLNLILGNACQKRCPYGDTCSEELCAQIWTGKASDTQCVFNDFRTKFIYEEQENT
jgi:hypothetical protein